MKARLSEPELLRGCALLDPVESLLSLQEKLRAKLSSKGWDFLPGSLTLNGQGILNFKTHKAIDDEEVTDPDPGDDFDEIIKYLL